MQAKRKTKPRRDVLHLGERFMAAEAVELHPRLVQFLEKKQAIAVDLGEVQSCDTAAVQLLLSALESFAEAGVPLELENLSAAVKNSIVRIGLTAEMKPALFAGKEG